MTKAELHALIREVLQEVTSEKQRRYMCAIKDKPADERPEGLSQAEAEEMCKSEVVEEAPTPLERGEVPKPRRGAPLVKGASEEEERQYLLQDLGELTVKQYLDLVAKAQKAEKMGKAKEAAKILPAEIIKSAGLVGVGVSIADMFKNMYSAATGKDVTLRGTQEKGIDDPTAFPVADKMGLDPVLQDVVEDRYIHKVDEEYGKYLETVAPTAKIKDLPSIDEFLRRYIAKRTNNRVVIRDESGK